MATAATSNGSFDTSQQSDLQKKQTQSKPRPKKLQAKPDSSSTKKQPKITKYFSLSSLPTQNDPPTDPEQTKIAQLKQELDAKQRQMAKLQEQKEFFENKYSLAYMENKNFKAKARQVLIRTLSQCAEIKRQARRLPDMRLGHFQKSMRFVEGQDLREIELAIQSKKAECTKIQGDLAKSKSDQQKDRLKFAITFLKKQLLNRQSQLKSKQKQVRLYRDKLKLGMQELQCYYESQKWSIVKDSHGNDRYLPLMLIGKGGFGQVYKCYDLEANQYVAIKINNIAMHGNGNGAKKDVQADPLKKKNGKTDKQHQLRAQEQANFILKHVEREVKTQKQLKHPNIVQIKQVLEMTQRRVIFVLEYCSGPELSLYLKQRNSLQQPQSKKIIHSIFSALLYLNELSTKVIHYDLKPSNIIFDRGVVKILDFGLCKLMDSQESRMELTSQGVGTYWYLPPETFKYDPKEREKAVISDKVDVWSTGVIFYELLYGVRPYGRDKSQQKILNEDLITRQSKQLKHTLFNIESPNRYRISKQAKAFITECLNPNPEKRLSVQQAYHHSYFKL